ncbi:AbgT family transporter [Xylanibacter muris]|uniref:ABC transporter substrate-binding protein n=1 Tax=Xylanibacter muris TaxID=2736290 RepID=A0ABX2AMJ7_9BACT|nr:AbgT family transporter [Xylanibacter muris]NPD91454.1 ABC transporter substrate-binding protein [Xylanibacter muris]
MRNRSKVYDFIIKGLLVSNAVLFVGAWLFAAGFPDMGIRSLLSAEGIRWVFSNFISSLQTPLLIYIILVFMAYGCVRESGILSLAHFFKGVAYRQRLALWFTLAVVVLYIGMIVFLTCIPHALLLSVTGELWPSPFSAALVPVISVGVMFVTVVYGGVSGSFHSFSDVIIAVCSGISSASPVIFLYILAMQFCSCVLYVAGADFRDILFSI